MNPSTYEKRDIFSSDYRESVWEIVWNTLYILLIEIQIIIISDVCETDARLLNAKSHSSNLSDHRLARLAWYSN